MTGSNDGTGNPFAGDGEMRARCRAIDWSSTSLGPVESWPRTLTHLLRTAFDSPFPINFYCGPEYSLIYNDAYSPILGAKHPDALGRPGREAWSDIWPDIEPMLAQVRGGGGAVYAENAPFVTRRNNEPNGGNDPSEPNAWFTFSLSPIRDDAGETVAYLNIVFETTDQVLAERATERARAAAERSEARLRKVFERAPTFMAVLRGPELVFEYVNTAYYQLIGQRDVIGKPLFDALPDVRGQGFEEKLEKVLTTGQPYVGREMPIQIARRPGGEKEERYLDFIYYPIMGADGSPTGVVAHGSDMTEHVLARRDMQVARDAAEKARAEAEIANKAKSRFLANMSHEIRTPINAIIGYADLLDAGVVGTLSEESEEYVSRIRASSQHLMELINDVLDFAKIESGKMAVGLEPLGAVTLVKSGMEMIAPQARAKGLSLREESDCGESAEFMGDAHRSRQILINLLSNALKFTGPGGTITVRCRTADTPVPEVLSTAGPWIVIEVEDTGSGIPEEELSEIFKPFVQAGSDDIRPGGGTGLGLTISRRFARLMGGELTVRSEPGKGSCFSLWLASAVRERASTAAD